MSKIAAEKLVLSVYLAYTRKGLYPFPCVRMVHANGISTHG